MRLTYKARLARQTKNYWVYEYGANLTGQPFVLYFPKADFGDDEPPKQAALELTAEAA